MNKRQANATSKNCFYVISLADSRLIGVVDIIIQISTSDYIYKW